MFACAKLACTPALVRSPAGPGLDLSACSGHVVEWAAHTGLSGHLPSPPNPVSFPPDPGAPRSAPSSTRAMEGGRGLAVRPGAV